MTVKKLINLLECYNPNSKIQVSIKTVEAIAVDVDTETIQLEDIDDVIDNNGNVLIMVETRHVPPY